MQTWPVPAVPPLQRLPTAASGAAAALIGCIARPDFATRALRELNHTLPVAWWTVYRVFDDHDFALEWCENRLLEAALPNLGADRVAVPEEFELFQRLAPVEIASVTALLQRRVRWTI